MAPSTCTLLFALTTSGDTLKVEFWASAGAVLGVVLFVRGFVMLRYKRIILNTPFSKIRSASMGLVEVSGVSSGPQTIPAGITGDPCYYYRAIAWRLRQSGNSRNWQRVADETQYVPFFVQDPTGRLLVDPQGADLDVHCNFKDEIGSSFLVSSEMLTTPAEQFLFRNGLSSEERIRLEEYCIKPGYPLFVLGTLGRNPEAIPRQWTPQTHVPATRPSHRLSFNIFGSANDGSLGAFGRLAGIQLESPAVEVSIADAQEMSAAAGSAFRAQPSSPPPAARWSTVSIEEEDAEARGASDPNAPRAPSSVAVVDPTAMRGAAQPGQTPASGGDADPDVAICGGAAGDPFTISSRSQREVVQSLAWKSALFIWGGPALTLGCLYLLFLALDLT